MSSNHQYHFKVLKISNQSSRKEIRDAYHKLALEWHPDKNRNAIWAKEYFQVVGQLELKFMQHK